MVRQNLVVDHDVFLMAAQKVQFIHFHVKPLLFPQKFRNLHNGFNDLCFNSKVTFGKYLHNINAKRCKLLAINSLLRVKLLLNSLDQANRQMLHEFGDLLPEVKQYPESLDQSTDVGLTYVKL